jgi:hypothetical protein
LKQPDRSQVMWGLSKQLKKREYMCDWIQCDICETIVYHDTGAFFRRRGVANNLMQKVENRIDDCP